MPVWVRLRRRFVPRAALRRAAFGALAPRLSGHDPRPRTSRRSRSADIPVVGPRRAFAAQLSGGWCGVQQGKRHGDAMLAENLMVLRIAAAVPLHATVGQCECHSSALSGPFSNRTIKTSSPTLDAWSGNPD